MEIQNIIVGLIVFAALFYVGLIVRRKLNSFSTKDSSCGEDCGCGNKAAKEFAGIKKS